MTKLTLKKETVQEPYIDKYQLFADYMMNLVYRKMVREKHKVQIRKIAKRWKRRNTRKAIEALKAGRHE